LKIIVASIALCVSGCASVQSVSSQMPDIMKKVNATVMDTMTGNSQYKQSGLVGAFANSDSQSGYPRMALTVLSMPKDAYKMITATGPGGTYALPSDYCMIFSAVVWKDSKTSRKFEKLNYCWSDRPRFTGTNTGLFMLWAQAPSFAGQNTGSNRTSGPIPPRQPFPQGAKYGNFANGRGQVLLNSFLASIDYDITVDMANDHRFWVVSIPSENSL
jgi:hypothetical protein